MITRTDILIMVAIDNLKILDAGGRRRGSVGHRDRHEAEQEDGAGPRNPSRLDRIWNG